MTENILFFRKISLTLRHLSRENCKDWRLIMGRPKKAVKEKKKKPRKQTAKAANQTKKPGKQRADAKKDKNPDNTKDEKYRMGKICWVIQVLILKKITIF